MVMTECKHYLDDMPVDEGVSSGSDIPQTSARVPWSGSSLGLSDLITLVPRARSILVGVLGAHDAGKTTLLLGSYLSCLRGDSIADAGFSGSRTLGAWESLAAWSRFDNAARQPHFPPHTPRGSNRSPGILHLTLRRQDQTIRDVLLTDAPGEWFSNWAVNENAHDAEGARWTIEHSDVFLLFADCERLSAGGRGGARNELRQLIERLGRHIDDRIVILVWAKSDITPVKNLSKGIRESIQRALKENLPNTLEVSTTVSKPNSLTEALALALNSTWKPRLSKPITEPVFGNNPFLAFRGFHANT
jgi:hypothetical protein